MYIVIMSNILYDLSIDELIKLQNKTQETDKIIVKFSASWCAPCKKMTPYLLKMQKEMTNKVTIVRLNADENKTLISQLKIDELPTLFIYKDNKFNNEFINSTKIKHLRNYKPPLLVSNCWA